MMTGTFADLYIGLYTNYISCQSSNLYLAFATVSLEYPQSSFELFYISSEYIASGATMTEIGLCKSITTTSSHTH